MTSFSLVQKTESEHHQGHPELLIIYNRYKLP